MKVLFGGLLVETAGLVWDLIMHFFGAAEGEGLIEPAHLVIFAGFVITWIGAILAYRAWHRIGSIS